MHAHTQENCKSVTHKHINVHEHDYTVIAHTQFSAILSAVPVKLLLQLSPVAEVSVHVCAQYTLDVLCGFLLSYVQVQTRDLGSV